MALGLQGIKLKVMVAIVLAVVASTLAFTVATRVMVSIASDLSLKERANETAKILSQAMDRQLRQLVSKVEVLSQNSEFQQDLQWETLDEVKRMLTTARESSSADIAVAVNIKGDAVAESMRAGFSGAMMLGASSLAEARRTLKSARTTEIINDRVMFIATAPVVFSGQTNGFTLLGSVIDDKALGELKEFTAADLQLIQNGKVRARTTPLDSDEGIIAGLEGRLPGQDSIKAVDGLKAGGKPLLSWALPLRSSDKLQAVLLFSLSAKEAAAIKERVTRAALLLAVIVGGLFGLAGMVYAKRISEPIVEIEQSFRQIAASGDLSLRITKPYDDEVGKMADSFNQMQNQIEALHGRVVVAEQRMRSELQMASTVQEMLLPPTVVEGMRCHFASHAQTSTETGGDWYTVIHSPAQHNTTVIVADVTGHGAPAALVTAILHGFINAVKTDFSNAQAGDWSKSVTGLLNDLNRTIIESTRRSLVLSLFVLSFDHRNLVARYLNAGHLAPILVRDVGGRPQLGIISTPPSSLIGDVDQPNFAYGQIQLEPDQMFLVYTDGLIECTNAAQEQYGFKRLRGVLSQNAHLDASTLRDTIYSQVAHFFGDTPPADDITFVVGRVIR